MFEGCECIGSVDFDTGTGSVETLSLCFPREGFATTDPGLHPPSACAPPSDRCLALSNISDVLAFFQHAYWERGRLAASGEAVAPLSTALVWEEYVCTQVDAKSCNGETAGALCAPWATGKLCSGCAAGWYRSIGGMCEKCIATDPLRAIGVPILAFFVVGCVVFVVGVLLIFTLVLCKNAVRIALEDATAKQGEGEQGEQVEQSGEEEELSMWARLCPVPGVALQHAAQLSLWSVLQLQLIATTASAFAGRAPKWMLWFYTGLRIALFEFPNSNSACVKEIERNFPFAKQEALFAMTIIVVLLSTAMCIKLFRAENCCLRCADERVAKFMTEFGTPYFRLALFFYLNTGYAYITMTALESVDCVQSPGSAGLWLERRPETRCWASSSSGIGAAHWPLAVLATIVLVIYSVGYPLCSCVFIYYQVRYLPLPFTLSLSSPLHAFPLTSSLALYPTTH